MADVSQIKLPNGSVYDLIDEKSGYITAEYIENKTDYEIPVSRVGEIVVGETAIGTDSTNFPTSKAVVDYVDERVVQEMDAIDVGVTGIKANGTSLAVENGVVNIPGANMQTGQAGLFTQEVGQSFGQYVESVRATIPTSTSQLNNDSGFITASDIPTTDLSGYMQKGVDYVTAGQKSGTTLGTKATAEGYNNTASGVRSHAEGANNTSSGSYSHAEGYYTTASGDYSHVEGRYTIAQSASQHVFGEYNIADTQGSNQAKGTYVEIVGNGSAINKRSNARTLDWNGNEVLAGKLTVGTGPTNNMDVATKQYVDNAIPTVPTNISSFTNDSGYLTASDIASVMTYKGTKANYAALPSTGNTTGDVWHLTDTGAEWAWDGSAWQELGTAIDLSNYATKATTLAGYGITDAKIQNGTITLGSNTITPLTSFTETDPTVPSWAKQSTKPSYGLTEISGTDDLRAIESLTGTSGLLKKTAANTWTLDTNTYLTSYTETDPVFSASAAAGITSTDISNWNAKPSTDTNTTYTLSNALSSHKFTSTLTAGGSGSGTSTATMEFVAGTGITLTDDTTNKKITIASSVVNTDEKLKVVDLNGANSNRSLIISSVSPGTSTTTATAYISSKLYWNDGSSTLRIGVINETQTIITPTTIRVGNNNNTYSFALVGAVTADRTITLPDATGTVALTSDTFQSTSATLTTAGWSSKTQTVNVTGVTASNTVVVSPAPTSHVAYCEAGIYCSAQGAGTLTFTCDEVPESALTVNILYK